MMAEAKVAIYLYLSYHCSVTQQMPAAEPLQGTFLCGDPSWDQTVRALVLASAQHFFRELSSML